MTQGHFGGGLWKPRNRSGDLPITTHSSLLVNSGEQLVPWTGIPIFAIIPGLLWEDVSQDRHVAENED